MARNFWQESYADYAFLRSDEKNQDEITTNIHNYGFFDPFLITARSFIC